MSDRDLSKVALDTLRIADCRPRDRISPHFRLYELTRSDIASRQGIANDFPGDAELHAAINLAREILEPVRAQFGAFTPNSVFRSQALERALKRKPSGWVSSSQHARGEACDIEIVGHPTIALAEWVADNVQVFDQIICECHDPAKGPNSGWVHVSLRPPGVGRNRAQLLSYVRDPRSGAYRYVPGLTHDTA
jgi:hypothetical protein